MPLADLLGAELQGPDPHGNGSAGGELWSAVGKCIRHFHENGVVHADLNARNILIRGTDGVYLIDFDRAKIVNAARGLFESNLRRLRRSLDKLWPRGQEDKLQHSWACLQKAYRAESSQ